MDEIHRVARDFGIDAGELKNIIDSHPTDENINEFNRFDKLIESISEESKRRLKEQFETKTGEKIPNYKLNIKIRKNLKEYILSGGFDA